MDFFYCHDVPDVPMTTPSLRLLWCLFLFPSVKHCLLAPRAELTASVNGKFQLYVTMALEVMQKNAFSILPQL